MDKMMVILFVKDQNRAKNFYEKVLRKNPILDVEGMTEFKLTKSTSLGLMPYDGIKNLLDIPNDPPDDTYFPKAELYLFVESIDEKLALVKENGGSVIKKPFKAAWGDYVAYGQDSDGHILAFSQKT